MEKNSYIESNILNKIQHIKFLSDSSCYVTKLEKKNT
jgi:hypothetical protein